jgi:hypothetical protein
MKVTRLPGRNPGAVSQTQNTQTSIAQRTDKDKDKDKE